jgi:branched-chain amino acid transport system substrate-binding protein
MISALAVVAALGLTGRPAFADEVKLGVVLATTGTFSFVGASATNAIKLAYDDLQAKNFFGDTKVTMIYEDNRSLVPEAISLITRLATQDKAIMILGPVSSGEGMATGPVAVQLKIPLFTTATSPGVLAAGPWVFKYTEDAEVFMANLAKVIVEKVKPKSCFSVSIRDNEGYIRQTNILLDALSKGGINIAAKESILAADTDFTSLATKIVASKADCLYLGTPPEQGANIVLQAKQAGLPNSTVLIGNTGMAAVSYLKAGGAAVDGTYIPAEFAPDGVNDLSRAFIANYTKRYGIPPDSYAAAGYSMMLIAGTAIKNAGPHPTRDSVRDEMAKSKNIPVVIGQGSFSIDADRHATFGTAVLVLRDGKWKLP